MGISPEPAKIPTPYPNLTFPETEAQAVIDAARQALNAVKNAAGDRRGKAASLKANAQWTGHAAEQFFGTDTPGAASDASSIVGQLNSLIQTVQGGINAYHDAQGANNRVAQANQQAFLDWLRGNPPALGL